MAAKTVEVVLKLDHIVSDRTQFKPYIAQLVGENIYVKVNVPLTEVERQDKKIILTVDGLAAVMGKVATAIDTMNEEYRLEKFGH